MAAVPTSRLASSTALRGSRSPVSYMNRARSFCRAMFSTSTNSPAQPTRGMMPRPDCLAASSEMRCQRSSFFSGWSGLATQRLALKNRISWAPASTDFWMM